MFDKMGIYLNTGFGFDVVLENAPYSFFCRDVPISFIKNRIKLKNN